MLKCMDIIDVNLHYVMARHEWLAIDWRRYVLDHGNNCQSLYYSCTQQTSTHIVNLHPCLHCMNNRIEYYLPIY